HADGAEHEGGATQGIRDVGCRADAERSRSMGFLEQAVENSGDALKTGCLQIVQHHFGNLQSRRGFEQRPQRMRCPKAAAAQQRDLHARITRTPADSKSRSVDDGASESVISTSSSDGPHTRAGRVRANFSESTSRITSAAAAIMPRLRRTSTAVS